jgi:hypothetical protein
MKKIITSVAVAMMALTVGCAVEPSESEEVTAPAQEETVEGHALIGTAGYCVIANGVYNGKCRANSGLCAQGTARANCPIGGTPNVTILACGVTIDSMSSCRF